MADTAVCLLIDKLSSLLIQEFDLIKDVDKEIAEIKDELESIQSFLIDAEMSTESEDRFNNVNGIKTWVKQVREIAYRIEDVIDEYLMFDSSKHFWGSRFICFVPKLKPRHDLVCEIRSIKVLVCEIKERSERYGLCNGVKNIAGNDPRVASHFIKEVEVVGVESTKNELIDWLIEEVPSRKVISVVGMGGLGKTTLAKIVYDNDAVRGHFECNAWITVSQSYKKKELLRNIIRQFCLARKEVAPPEGIDIMEEVLLITKLREYLHQKRYVVVFDDVWKIDFWGDIEHALPDNHKGSRIMITTRIKDVASFCKKSSFVHVHELQSLPQNKAWELLCRKAFQFDSNGQCPQELEKLCLDIVEKCEGMPLAIVAIGGLLSAKDRNVSEWKKLLDRLGSELECNPHLTCVTKILSLSYQDLPYNLKSCLLYFGIFPEDYNISQPRLISEWIAEGFVKEKKGTTLEGVAGEYLTELVNRNLVQVSWGEFNGVNKNFRVHDILREIILAKIEQLNFCQVLEENESSLNSKARRLSINNSINNVQKTVKDSRVRSLFLFNIPELPKSIIDTLFQSFKLLKVLDCQDAPLSYLPKEVGNLFHLEYLSMKNTKINMVPKSIGKLRNLQTLNLKRTQVHQLPIEINKLLKLRHLLAGYVNHEIHFSLDSIRGVKIHDGIGCLGYLQTLSYVEANQGGSLIKELEKLTQLKVLGISNLATEDGNSLCSSVKKMNHLISLEVISVSGNQILDLQSISSSPPQFLWDVFLRGHLEKLPNWILELKNLVTICLFFSRMNEDPVKKLSLLPNLTYLYLYQAYHGYEMHIQEGGFTKLKLLSLRNLNELNSLIIENKALVCLEELEIGPSPQLKEVPAGICCLRELKTLVFYDMPVEFTLTLQEQDRTNRVFKHIPSVLFSYRIKGEHYETYKLGNPDLLKHIMRV